MIQENQVCLLFLATQIAAEFQSAPREGAKFAFPSAIGRERGCRLFCVLENKGLLLLTEHLNVSSKKSLLNNLLRNWYSL